MTDVLQEWWQHVTAYHYAEITIRLFLAALLGGLVGLEREHSNRPAGFRTHILVCVGSALIMLISMFGFQEFIEHQPGTVVSDPARLAAQVVSGIGFLGAGTILVHGMAVRGLTTAASLWVVAGIGLSLGSGFYYGALLATGIVLASLVFLNRFENVILRRRNGVNYLQVLTVDDPGQLGNITTILGNLEVQIKKVAIDEGPQRHEKSLNLSFTISVPAHVSTTKVIERLQAERGVLAVTVE
jgi:putative Mg2+ transporter-C (MgtC) family protein